MSLSDPECHPELHGDDRQICSGCFEDIDLKNIIKIAGDYGSCDFCGSRRAKTVELSYIARHISDRANAFYGKAADQMPYESAEGGYLGNNFDTYDLLTNQIGIDLPRDTEGNLLWAIVEEIGDHAWCAYNWNQLEIHESLAYSWKQFTERVKHERRFFFHGNANREGPPDDRSPLQFFFELRDLLEQLGRVRTYQPGLSIFRARPRNAGERHTSPAALGPPPAELALQANRMNPPGIPMFYGADRERMARAEVGCNMVSLGRFETTRVTRVIDLVDLPAIPGFFSNASRDWIQRLTFLHEFAKEISLPVPRDDRVNVEYLPTQVFTEFLRDVRFHGGPIDGLRYSSATLNKGANFVFFATQDDIVGAAEENSWFLSHYTPWLRLVEVKQKRGSKFIAP